MEDVDASSIQEDNASVSWCVGGPLHNKHTKPMKLSSIEYTDKIKNQNL